MQINPLNNIRIEKLWENPSPNNVFNAQNIDLSKSDYSWVLVFYKVASSATAAIKTTIVPKGFNIYLDVASWQSGNTAATYDRTLTYTSDSRYSAGGAELNGIANNGLCIPYQIYGIYF